jgi:gliding motility-associated-like protein
MRFFTFLFLIISFGTKAQNTCTGLGQTPSTAIPACVTAALSQPSVSGCDNGLVFVPICTNDGSGTVYTAVNPYWYSFTCYQSGTLAFSILPVSPTDDYDWQLYDVTGVNTSSFAFLTNPSLVVGANWSGAVGATGALGTVIGPGIGDFSVCAGQTQPLFSIKPNLIIGHDYLLLVSNFSPSGLGYALSFGANTGGASGSTALLVDPLEPPTPLLASATSLCGTAVKIKTNKKVRCNTLALNGSDFSVIAPDGITVIPPISASAINCATGLVFDSVIINMGTLLPPGTYKVRIKNGTDGNTLRDKCDNLIPVNDEVSFVVSPLPAAPTVTSPVNFCQNITAIALTATGTSLLWYTTATGGTGSATAPIPATTTVGPTIYYVSQTIAGCEGPRAAITVNVNAAPAAPTVTTPVAYCQNIAATALTATGTGLLWYTTATGGVGSTTAFTPITTAPGAFNFYVTQTVAGCQSPRAQIVVNVTATPAAPGVTTPVTVCQGATATGLTATGTGLLWYAAATGGTGTITIPFPPTGSVGSTTYYVSQTVNNCESPRAAIVVNVVAPPAAPSASTPITYCQGYAAAALTATTGVNLLWYTVASGGIGSATAPTPSTTLATSTMYYVSQTVGTCESQRAAILVIVKATPGAPTVTTPVAYCQTASASALGATGTNLLWYSLPTGGGVGSATAPTPSTAAGGSTIYYVTQTVNGCESNPRTGITVNVTATPAAPTATTPVTYCQNTASAALSATGTNLLWYTVATAGSGSATAPIPSTTNAGSTTYYVSQSTGVCEGPRFAIVVNITAEPLAPVVTTPVTYCQNATAIALTASGTNLLWYTAATGGTGTTTAPIPSTTAVGSTIYYVSQSTTCVSPRAAITVVIKATPLAPAVTTPVAYCQNATPTTLSATGASLLWYTAATGGVGSTTAPTPSTTAGGITTYYVTQTVNGCESPRAAIVINVTATPAAPTVVSPLNICQGTTASALTAGGTNLLWYNAATGGTGSATAPIPSTTGLGSTNYYVSQTINGCEGPTRALLTVTVNITPAAPGVTTPVTYCQNATATVLTATGTNLKWYTSATGGTGSTTAPLPSTTAVGSTTYYVSQTTGTCEGPRAAITVNINITPTAPTVTASVPYCQNATATVLTAGGTNLLWYTTATLGTGSTIAPTPNTTIAATTSYYVSQTTGICEGPRAKIDVVVTAIPAAPAVTSPVVYCQGTTAIALTAPGTNLKWYTLPTGGTGATTAPIPLTTATGSTTYYVSQSTNNCEGPRAAIVVTVNATPVAPTVTSPVVHCQNATTSPLVATGSNLQWYTTATGGTASTTAITPSSTNAGTFTFYVADKLGNCEGPRAAIVVNITATPTAPTVVSPINYCPNDIATPLTAGGINLLWYTTATGGIGTTVAPTPPTNIFPVTNIYYVSQSTSVATGSCQGPRAQIITNVNNVLTVSIGADTLICEGTSVKFSPVVTPIGATYVWRAIGVPLSTIDDVNIKDATVQPVDTATYILKATLGGCSKEDTVNVNVIWKPILNMEPTKAICLNDIVALKGLMSRKSSDSINYEWAPATDTTLTTPKEVQTNAQPIISTLYTLSFKTKPIYGCDFSGTGNIKVVVQSIKNPFAGNDTIAVKGLSHQLHGSGGLNYSWTSPTGINITNAQSQNAYVTLFDDANFYLKITDAIGCEGRDTIFIKVYDGPTYYIPNSFTPNADGMNDIFRAIPVGIVNTTYFRVFNRAGVLVFETNKFLKGWDGTYKNKPQPNGTYVWIVAGTNKDNKKVEMKGTVNLLR